LRAEERVFVDGFKESLIKTLASEEFPINDVPGMNRMSCKRIMVHFTPFLNTLNLQTFSSNETSWEVEYCSIVLLALLLMVD
ncbi:hypothetical protein Tco_0467246, partial [Tanacetum coccineum]